MRLIWKDEHRFLHLSRKYEIDWTKCLRCGKLNLIFYCLLRITEEKKSYIKTTHNMSGSLSHHGSTIYCWWNVAQKKTSNAELNREIKNANFSFIVVGVARVLLATLEDFSIFCYLFTNYLRRIYTRSMNRVHPVDDL